MTSSTQDQITTESGNRQNIFPVEAQPQLIENYSSYVEDAEKANGRWAMIGFVALIGSYITTGQIIPGVF
ncbi:high light inducible protein [Prochlorococcus marinus]|uniref:high light inducible protein n=1 Tax=Prochlorococcus marinus TaxID=1219 RepID=UPI0022B4550F|nr:high light inducible protein [Prochlorococcus marinus]